jgi:hypothetical protein
MKEKKYFKNQNKKNKKWRKIDIAKYVEWFDKKYGCNKIEEEK